MLPVKIPVTSLTWKRIKTQDTVHFNDIQHLKSFRRRSENSLLMQAWNLQTHTIFLFVCFVSTSLGKKKNNPSLNPDTTCSQSFLLCSSRSVFMRQSVTQHLCSSSPARAPPLTGVTRLPFPSVWHLPGDRKWRFQSNVKVCCRCTGPRCAQRWFSTPWLLPSPAEPHELWVMSRWVRAPPPAPPWLQHAFNPYCIL